MKKLEKLALEFAESTQKWGADDSKFVGAEDGFVVGFRTARKLAADVLKDQEYSFLNSNTIATNLMIEDILNIGEENDKT